MTLFTEQDLEKLRAERPDIVIHETTVRRQAIPWESDDSKLAAAFEAMWKVLGGPELEKEVRFHPTRKWRLDYALTAVKVAVEIEGGLFSQGRHIRPLGFRNDAEKYNAAASLGWTVFRLTTGQIQPDNLQPIIDFMESKAHG